jgi:hypothetical protein
MGFGIEITLNIFIVGIPTIIGHNSPQQEMILNELIHQGPWNKSSYVIML